MWLLRVASLGVDLLQLLLGILRHLMLIFAQFVNGSRKLWPRNAQVVILGLHQ